LDSRIVELERPGEISLAERWLAAASMIGRTEQIAFVIDGDRVLREANPQAEQTFRRGHPVQLVQGRVRLNDAEANAWFIGVAQMLSKGEIAEDFVRTFRNAEELHQVSAHALPTLSAGSHDSTAFDRLVLVLIRALHRRVPRNVSLLAELYGLTPAEVKMAELLAAGHTVASASESLGIRRETGRDRVKLILAKTETRRQSELMALLISLG
jgi:DNA-binding CsgD family transcriptional regulator